MAALVAAEFGFAALAERAKPLAHVVGTACSVFLGVIRHAGPPSALTGDSPAGA